MKTSRWRCYITYLEGDASRQVDYVEAVDKCGAEASMQRRYPAAFVVSCEPDVPGAGWPEREIPIVEPSLGNAQILDAAPISPSRIADDAVVQGWPKPDPDKRARALERKGAKPPIYQGLLAYFPRALREVTRVSAYGSVKHQFPLAEKGFLRPEYTVEGYLDASARHVLDWITEGEVNHEDGDLLHLAQSIWDQLAALEKILIEQEKGP